MKTLISMTSPTYMRRLVREINSRLRNGANVRARPVHSDYRVGVHGVKYLGGHRLFCNELWCDDGSGFWDGNGEEIVASREA